MKCPHCKKLIKMPTERQIEAYRLVHIHGCTQEEAGRMMGVSQPAISYLLRSLSRTRPDLFKVQMERISRKNTLSYEDTMACDVIGHF
jgi:predicted DNA-binding protein (UPF0251 family)